MLINVLCPPDRINLPLRGYDKHGRKVILQRQALADPNVYKPEVAMRVNTMISEAMVIKEDFQMQV